MPNRPLRLSLMILLAAGAAPSALLAQDAPLSAIDWLSESVAASAPPKPEEPAVTTEGLIPEDIAVSVLGGPSPDAAGLLAPEVTGFPRELWGLGKLTEVTTAIGAARVDGVPALQSLLVTLLIAEVDPPADSGGRGDLLIARVDRLLALGALEEAEALLAAAGETDSAQIFRRAFDVALLTGAEDAACQRMLQAPQLAPTLTARVFCLARSGDWNAAALTLRTSQALGHVTGLEDALLSRFLDPDLYEGEPVPPPPSPMTPLIWRIYDAIGEPLPTTTLPLAFAHAELSDRAGWKAQLEAAERLARAGVIPANRLLGLYTEREPAASGGVWDRAEAFQRFDEALARGDLRAVEQRLPLAWARMADVEAEVPFAELYGARLSGLALTGDAARIAWEMGLLSPDYDRLAGSDLTPGDSRAAFLNGIAAGSVTGLAAPDSLARAIAPAFSRPVLPTEADALLAQNRKGEAILLAIRLVGDGLHGEPVRLAQGLSLLRHLGLEEVARRAALQIMVLERRG